MNTIDLLEKLVSIPSSFPNEEKISNFLCEYLKQIGFKVQRVKSDEKRYSIVATFGRSKNYLGFYGHMDTVPVDKNYKTDPLKLTIKDNRAYGLGAADMKGGITAILQMASFAKENNLPIKVVFGVDEEDISLGAHDLVDSKLLDDLNFLIVGESGQVKDINKPFSVVFGRKGRIFFDIEIFGKKAHAAEAGKGVNAITQAAELICNLQTLKFPNDVNLGTTDIIVQEVTGQTDSFSVPDYCLIRCSVLTNPRTSGKDFIFQVKKMCQNLSIKVQVKPHPRKTAYGESYAINTENSFLKKVQKQIIDKFGAEPFYTPSVADENVFANRLKIPVLTLGPIGGNGHIADEWLNIKSLETVEQVYKDILVLYHND